MKLAKLQITRTSTNSQSPMGLQTRMLKILVALALSMISGAWLLASTRPGLRQMLPSSGVLLQAQGPTQTTPVLPTAFHWQDIVIRCEPTNQHKPLPANRFNGASPAHLAIVPSGLIRVLPAWERIQAGSGQESHLVIRVESTPLSRELSLDQLQALGSLLEKLAGPGDGARTRVRCESIDPSPPSLAAEVRRMVADLPFLIATD